MNNPCHHKFKLYFHCLLFSKPLKRLSKPVIIYIKNKMLGDKDQYIVIEHPKCGRTWLRYMINQAESRYYNVPLTNTIYGIWYSEYSLPRANYVHGFNQRLPLNEQLLMKVSNESPRQKGWILLVRSPERVMISYYNHCVFRDKIYPEDTIASFIRDEIFGIERYIKYVEHYYTALQPYKHMIVTYESLRDNTNEFLEKILDFIELPLSMNDIKEIVNNSTLNKMKELEKSGKYNIGWIKRGKHGLKSAKVRTGGSDNLTQYFSSEDLNYMKSCYQNSKPFIELGYTN